MDEADIDVQVVSHTAPGLEWVSAVESPALAREANDVLLDAIAKNPDRLTGLAALPVSAPRTAAAELQRAVELGLKGALINGTADGRFLDAPEFGDVLTCAEELGVPLYVHPGVPSGPGQARVLRRVLRACLRGAGDRCLGMARRDGGARAANHPRWDLRSPS